MKTNILLTLAIFVCVSGIALPGRVGPAFGQERRDTSEYGQQLDSRDMRYPSSSAMTEKRSPAVTRDIRTADRLMGKTIIGKNDEKLGEIAQVIFNPDNGRVAYVVVSTEGFPSTGGDRHVVPATALHRDAQGNLSLNLTQDQFAASPRLKDYLIDPKWGADVNQYYGVAPYWEEQGTGSMSPAPAPEREKRSIQQGHEGIFEPSQGIPEQPEGAPYDVPGGSR